MLFSTIETYVTVSPVWLLSAETEINSQIIESILRNNNPDF